jgi:hypothetical protein
LGNTQLVYGILIVAVLVGLALYYAWRQWQTLGKLRSADVPPDEYLFLRNQAYRRLAGCALMLLLAGLFVGLLFLEKPAAELVGFGEEARARDEHPEMDAAQKSFFRFYGGYTIVVLLVLMAIIGLAGYEIFAIRRFSLHHLKKIQAERRAMIESETARIRSERNGHT